MRLLLINANPIIKKLVSLSAQKSDIAVVEVQSYGEVSEGEYDLIFIDDQSYNKDEHKDLLSKVSHKKTAIFVAKEGDVPGGFDIIIQKPFLPTELVEIFGKEKSAPSASSFDKSGATAGLSEIEDVELDALLGGEDDGDRDFDISSELDEDISGGIDSDIGADLDLGLDEDEIDLESNADEISLEDEADSSIEDELKLDEDMDLDSEIKIDDDEPGIDSMNELKEDELSLDEEFSLEDSGTFDGVNGEETEDAASEEGGDLDLDLNTSDEEDLSLDTKESEEDMGMLDEKIEDDNLELDSITDLDQELLGDFGSLDEEDNLAEDSLEDMSNDDLSLSDMGDLGDDLLDAHTSEMDENLALDEEMDELGGVLDRGEISEVKNLLEDSDDDIERISIDTEIEDEDELGDLKIENSELASLTEEALSEALGEEIEDDTHNIEDGFSLTNIESITKEDVEPKNLVEDKKGVNGTEALASLGALDIPTIKKILDGMQITINISFPNK